MDSFRSELRSLPFWGDLSCREETDLEASCQERTYRPGQTIRSPEDDRIGLVLILNGEARGLITSPQGREISLFTLYPGDTCTLGSIDIIRHISEDVEVRAVTPCRLLWVRQGTLTALSESNLSVRTALLQMTLERLPAILDMVRSTMFTRLDERLACYLLMRYHKTGSAILPISQEQIARDINSAREAVSRELKRFSEEGLVDCRRCLIELLDIGKLEEVARE